MTTITLPEDLASRLQQQAAFQHRSVEAVAIDILADALESTSEALNHSDLIARIKRTPPRPQSVRPSQDSLFEALQRIPDDPHFDLQQWDVDWQQVERELRNMDRIDVQSDQPH